MVRPPDPISGTSTRDNLGMCSRRGTSRQGQGSSRFHSDARVSLQTTIVCQLTHVECYDDLDIRCCSSCLLPAIIAQVSRGSCPSRNFVRPCSKSSQEPLGRQASSSNPISHHKPCMRKMLTSSSHMGTHTQHSCLSSIQPPFSDETIDNYSSASSLPTRSRSSPLPHRFPTTPAAAS